MIIYGGRKYLYDKLFVSLFFFFNFFNEVFKKKKEKEKERNSTDGGIINF